MLQILQVSPVNYGDDNYVQAKDLFEELDVQAVVVRLAETNGPVYIDKYSSLFTKTIGLTPVMIAVCLHNGCQIKIIYGQLFGVKPIEDDWDIDAKWLDTKISASLKTIKESN